MFNNVIHQIATFVSTGVVSYGLEDTEDNILNVPVFIVMATKQFSSIICLFHEDSSLWHSCHWLCHISVTLVKDQIWHNCWHSHSQQNLWHCKCTNSQIWHQLWYSSKVPDRALPSKYSELCCCIALNVDWAPLLVIVFHFCQLLSLLWPIPWSISSLYLPASLATCSPSTNLLLSYHTYIVPLEIALVCLLFTSECDNQYVTSSQAGTQLVFGILIAPFCRTVFKFKITGDHIDIMHMWVLAIFILELATHFYCFNKLSTATFRLTLQCCLHLSSIVSPVDI